MPVQGPMSQLSERLAVQEDVIAEYMADTQRMQGLITEQAALIETMSAQAIIQVDRITELEAVPVEAVIPMEGPEVVEQVGYDAFFMCYRYERDERNEGSVRFWLTSVSTDPECIMHGVDVEEHSSRYAVRCTSTLRSNRGNHPMPACEHETLIHAMGDRFLPYREGGTMGTVISAEAITTSTLPESGSVEVIIPPSNTAAADGFAAMRQAMERMSEGVHEAVGSLGRLGQAPSDVDRALLDVGFFRANEVTVDGDTVRFNMPTVGHQSFCNVCAEHDVVRNAIRVTSIAPRNLGTHLVPDNAERLVPFRDGQPTYLQPTNVVMTERDDGRVTATITAPDGQSQTYDASTLEFRDGNDPMSGVRANNETQATANGGRQRAALGLPRVLEEPEVEAEPEVAPEVEAEAPPAVACPDGDMWFVPERVTYADDYDPARQHNIELTLGSGSTHDVRNGSVVFNHGDDIRCGVGVMNDDDHQMRLDQHSIRSLMVSNAPYRDPDGYFVPAEGIVHMNEHREGRLDARIVMVDGQGRHQQYHNVSYQIRRRAVSSGVRVLDDDGDVLTAFGNQARYIPLRLELTYAGPREILEAVEESDLDEHIYGPHCPRCESLSVRGLRRGYTQQCTACGARWSRDE